LLIGCGVSIDIIDKLYM